MGFQTALGEAEMHEDVEDSRRRVSRRRLLGGGATVGLSALLAACAPTVFGSGGRSPESSAPGSEATPTPLPTASDGEVIAPSTESTSDLIARLDAVGSCRLTSQETQGPYWFDVDSIRSDIREDRPGAPLHLILRVYDRSCRPLPNSVVEIWHCDAGGIYSGYEVASTGGERSSETDLSDGAYSAGDRENVPADDGTYLRGAQVADANGIVQFRTIWPGWYTGRTVHIHLKVHIDRQNVLTSQLYFDDELNDRVHVAEPYASHSGRDTRNDSDGIYDPTGLLTTESSTDGHLAYTNLGVDL